LINLFSLFPDPNVPFAEMSSNVVLASSVPKEILRSKNITSSLLPRAVLASVVSVTPYSKSKVAVITFADKHSAETVLTSSSPGVPSSNKASSVRFHRAYLLLRNSPLLASVADVKAKRFRDNDVSVTRPSFMFLD
jgi:hypothetical protein